MSFISVFTMCVCVCACTCVRVGVIRLLQLSSEAMIDSFISRSIIFAACSSSISVYNIIACDRIVFAASRFCR